MSGRPFLGRVIVPLILAVLSCSFDDTEACFKSCACGNQEGLSTADSSEKKFANLRLSTPSLTVFQQPIRMDKLRNYNQPPNIQNRKSADFGKFYNNFQKRRAIPYRLKNEDYPKFEVQAMKRLSNSQPFELELHYPAQKSDLYYQQKNILKRKAGRREQSHCYCCC